MTRLNQTYHTLLALLLLLVIGVCTGCSTQKNTKASRSFHQFTTHYNIYFNANTSYETGIKTIEKANQDDFSTIIPMYAISNHDNTTLATVDMERCIEKCRKAIKNHSISKKPKRDPKKLGDAKYKEFLNFDEYVPAVCDAWLMLGKAELHKGDFLGAIGTFSYIIKHYPHHPETVDAARLWLVRAYGEQGWVYEAEQALSKINENQISYKQTGLYAETKAYLLLLNKQYTEAIPFLKKAIDKSRNRYQTTRFNYILAQIYQQQGKRSEAIDYYSRVKKMNPNYMMQFNAELERYQLESGKNQKAMKGLAKMARNSNNSQYKDQIYHAMGDAYLQRNDTAHALKMYQKGVEESTRNGIDKAELLITMGDIYYARRDYVKAEPCFTDAAMIINSSYEDFARVNRLNENLSELVTQITIVHLQDSLQHLAGLSEKDQRKAIDNIIKQVIADEEAAKKKAEEEKDVMLANTPSVGSSINTAKTPNKVGGGLLNGNTAWYFYNPTLIAGGKSQFRQKWGARKLEDNWRRQNKSASALSNTNDEESTTADSSDKSNDPTNPADSTTTPKDNKDPLYYLAQLPTTPDALAQSNSEIATALYIMGELFASKINDEEMAIETFDEFQRRFPEDSRKLESYYYCYRLYGKQNDTINQGLYRNKIVTEFPESNYALMLSHPDYAERVKEMYARQDSIYKATYSAYSANQFSTVFATYEEVKQEYPMSPLLPKFAFLNALSLGKAHSDTALYSALTELIISYPKSDVTATAKDILALKKQGLTATQGTAHGNLLNKRATQDSVQQVQPPAAGRFTNNPDDEHLFVLVLKNEDKTTLNKLLYDLAAYNFTKFMIKEFDVEQKNIDGKDYVAVLGFANRAEVEWYEQGLMSEPLFQGRVTLDVCERYIISVKDLKQINTLGWKAYNDYLKDATAKPSKKTTKK